jgi:hypothetical protein
MLFEPGFHFLAELFLFGRVVQRKIHERTPLK